jgi:hypothetical protein
LSTEQHLDLNSLLSRFQHPFRGELGKYPNAKVHLDLRENVQPARQQAYPVPHSKKRGDGCVHWVSDSYALNKVIKRHSRLLQQLSDTLHTRSGYKFFTKLDVSMMSYTFELVETSSRVASISLHLDKIGIAVRQMGIK